MLTDTHPEAEKVLNDLLRQASDAKRISIVRSLTNLALRMSRQAVAEAHPELSPWEAKLLWIELHYGKPLADELREHIQRNPTCFPERDLPPCDPL
jgi:hypothetical protein